MSITIADVADKLLTIDQVREKLAPTENLVSIDLTPETRARFSLTDWNVGEHSSGLSMSGATATVDGNEFALTKDAALAAFSNIGIQKAYALKTPARLLEPQLNYWYGEGDRSWKMLVGGEDTAVAFVKHTIQPFSNFELLDHTLDAIAKKFGSADDVMVDYKFTHDLIRTNMRLIIPEQTRHMNSVRGDGVFGNDPWSAGIEIRNSLTGKIPLELQGYLFAYVCTNGMTSNHASSGKYRRKITQTPQDAYDWAESVVEDVLGGLEHELDAVQALTEVSLGSNLNQSMGPLFDQFDVPDRQREHILANLAEGGDLSAYGLLAAVTAAANSDDVSPDVVSSLLNIGGELTHSFGSAHCPLESLHHSFI